MATIGKYKGQDIQGGTDAQVQAQIQAINSGSSGGTATNTGGGGSTIPAPTYKQGNTRNGNPIPDRITVGGGTKSYSYDYAKSHPEVFAQYQKEQDALKGEEKTLDEQAPEVKPGEMQQAAQLNAYAPGGETNTLPQQTGGTTTGGGVVPQPQGGTAPSGGGNQFQQGLQAANQAKASGEVNNAQGRAMVQQYLPKQPQTQVADGLMDSDPIFADIQSAYQAYYSPQNQRQSLTEMYQSMQKSAGLDDINTELMNMRNIMEGTEDDIRMEVTKAGGFATDSQVQAMTNVRNKQMVKNYNNLLETKQMMTEQINTMMSLAEKDRSYADQQFSQMMNFEFQSLQYRDKMKENAMNRFQWMASQPGGFEAIQAQAASSPQVRGMVDKMFGGMDGLQTLANTAASDRALDRAYKQAQLANIYKSLNEGGSGGVNTLNGKEQNQAQLTAQGFADRTVEANNVLLEIGDQFADPLALGKWLPGQFQTADRQKFEQAKRNFVNAVLRKESGAAIGADEFSSAEKQYFPQPGDTKEVLEQKAENRNTVINNLYREANIPRPVSSGDIIQADGKKYRVGDDGETLIEI